jgi:hypothetical protein|tara:strand:+ start:677 stop:1747 length:1071 start_codon:yes stop_codon:yes gene_type:complete
MAYDFIPKSQADIQKAGVFLKEHARVYEYLHKKFNRNDPIALSLKPDEKKTIKVTRAFQSVTTIQELNQAIKIKDTKLSFGEGSRGGRGVANKGGQFEIDLTKDLETWWEDEKNYKSKHSKKIIEEMSKEYGWAKSKKFDVNNEGGLNQKRPLIFTDQPYIGTSGDQNIGKTVTDITVTTDKGPVYLSLKATGTVTFFNAGVTKYLIADEMRNHRTIKNKQGLTLLKMLGLNPRKLADVFNSYGGKQERFTENVYNKLERPKLIKFLKSGMGYGYHYVHAKNPNEIHHFKMTKEFMTKLANPTSAVAYYGGKKSAGKRVDIDIETPFITLKINIRNKQGGVYPSHIMCDYTFKKYK